MNALPTELDSIRGGAGLNGQAWISETAYWMPPHVVESAWLEHAPFAYWIVEAIRPNSIVELGTHNGFSYFVFCEAIVRLGLPTRAFALDSWEGDDHAGFYGEDVFERVSAVNAAEYSLFSTLLRGYFDESLDSVEDASVDLLHIDGRHGYEDVRHDFEAWCKKLTDRGVVIFHDIAEHQEGFGVWQFWSEISQQYPSFAFDHGHGLGVLAVGSDVPEKLRAFLDASAERPDDIKAVYESLGANVSRQYLLEVAAGETERMRGELWNANQQIEAHRDQIAEQAADLCGLREQLEELQQSTSWKVTRPLRTASDIVHRRRG